MLELRTRTYDHPDAALLVAAVQREYVARYGGEDATPVDAAEFAPPRGLFLIGYVAGEPVACGGWRSRAVLGDGDVLQDGDAEIKRMFVAAGHRNRGYARAVLRELEHTAAAAGRRRLVLETGLPQPEAIALYGSAGYTAAAGFGRYRTSPSSRYFAKSLQNWPKTRQTGHGWPICDPAAGGRSGSGVARTTEPAQDASG